MKMLTAEYGQYFGFSVSHTSRDPRPGEEDGKDYHFVSKEDMETAISNNEFLENTSFSGNLYGTSESAVEDVLDEGNICILDIDVKGVQAIKEKGMAARFVFIKPPSIEDLEERLIARKTETKGSLLRRLGAARAEMAYGETPGNFDIVITNDNLKMAYAELKQFILPDIQRLKPDHLNSRPLVICGPSGSGKSTLMKRLIEEFPNYVGFSVSHTTRQPRPGEEDNIDYNFVSDSEFER